GCGVQLAFFGAQPTPPATRSISSACCSIHVCITCAGRRRVRGDMDTAKGTDGSMTTETLFEDLRPELRRLRLEGWCRTVTGIAGLLLLSWLCYRYWPDRSAGALALGFLLITIFAPTVGSRWLSRRR